MILPSGRGSRTNWPTFCLYVIRFADKAGIDLEAIAERKIASNAAKYPADKFRGSDRKYDE